MYQLTTTKQFDQDPLTKESNGPSPLPIKTGILLTQNNLSLHGAEKF